MIPPLPAVVMLDFEPSVGLGALEVRWDAIALTAVLLLALMLWVRGIHTRTGAAPRWLDLALVLAATVVGAVVGGRLVHVLGFLDVYATDPVAALDLGRGTGSLVGAVVGGAVVGAWVCRPGMPGGTWADAAAVPFLVAIGGGKLALLLGGGGQGAPWDGAWALVYAGEGPWRSLDPAVPAWPSQALEGAWTLLGIPVVLLVERRLLRDGCAPSGVLLLVATAWWLAGRAVVAATWRDQPVMGGLGAEGVATLIALGMSVLALLLHGRARRRRPRPHPSPG